MGEKVNHRFKIALLGVLLLNISTTGFAVSAIKADNEGTVVAKLRENKRIEVDVYDRLHLVIDDEKVDSVLKLTGYGTRHNPLGSSYVIRNYCPDPTPLTEEGVLDELKAVKIKALRMDVVFPFKAATLREKLTDSLWENGIDAKTDPAVKGLVDQLTMNVSPHDWIDFISITRADGKDVIYIVGSMLKTPIVSAADPELGLKFWKIWFGKTSDADMTRLKKSLILGKN